MIDHYLGKELVENIYFLQSPILFLNPCGEGNIQGNVQLIFSEDFGTKGRER